MLLAVTPLAFPVPSVTFTFEVPGDQTWAPRSFRAIAQRAVGGTSRGYLLTITDSTTTVVAIGADDAGDEPGTCDVTWCDVPAAKVHAADVGIVVAPLPRLELKPGYVVTGEIINPAAGDTWGEAIAWYDFAYTG